MKVWRNAIESSTWVPHLDRPGVETLRAPAPLVEVFDRTALAPNGQPPTSSTLHTPGAEDLRWLAGRLDQWPPALSSHHSWGQYITNNSDCCQLSKGQHYRPLAKRLVPPHTFKHVSQGARSIEWTIRCISADRIGQATFGMSISGATAEHCRKHKKRLRFCVDLVSCAMNGQRTQRCTGGA